MRRRVTRRRRELLDHVRGRRHVRVPPAEVDERLPRLRGCGGDARQEPREVLLGEPLETVGPRAHG